jgi:xanthine dehydrogenase YagR molybdenum-binding subunit
MGMGMAAAARGNSLAPSEARATLQIDNSKALGVKAVIETDMTDIGTGSYTVFTQVAADLLGLPIDHIEMKLGDTSLPPAVGSGGSMGAASSGSSIYLACQQLREMIAGKVGLYPDTIQLYNGQIKQIGEHDANFVETVVETVIEAGKEKVAGLGDNIVDKVADLKDKLAEISLTESKEYDFSNFQTHSLADIVAQYDDQKLSAKGQIAPGKNAKSHRQASFGANFAEVAVHRVTGEIRVKRMTGAFAAGRILNHKTATSQCYGGMVFGIGSALMEQVIHDKHDGRLCNHNLAEYHVPVNADVPQLDVILVEEDDPYTNPMHIKGIGETAIAGAAAAIANAVYNAVGVRVYDFPITLDKLLYELPE